jgi:hypothetical protein
VRRAVWGRRKHSTTLQLARLVGRNNRNFDKRWLTGAVFLDVVQSFDTVWVKGLLYNLTVLNFPSSLVKIISSYVGCRTFPTSFKISKSTRRVMRAAVAQGGIVSRFLFGLHVNYIPSPYLRVELTH